MREGEKQVLFKEPKGVCVDAYDRLVSYHDIIDNITVS